MTQPAKHTPGPWIAALGERLNTDVYCTDAQGNRIFIAEFATQADAVLGAAAPAMYEALRALVEVFPSVVKMTPYGVPINISKIHDNAVAALAQAEARS